MAYRRTQFGWVVLVALLPGAGILTAVSLAGHTWFPLLALVPIALVFPLFGWLTVTVDDEAVSARFGVGLIRVRLPLREITGAAPVQNSPTAGWGIRHLPGVRLYNVSGLQAVEFALADGRRIRIGTDDPEGLLAAAHAARPLGILADSPDVSDARMSRAPVYVTLGVVMTFVVLTMVLATRPVTVTIPSGAIAINGRSYSARIPVSDVTRVHLDDALPRIRLRTNGAGFNGRLRGHFRLADGRPAQIFTSNRQPPFITLETPTEPVIVNLEQPSETRELYAQLEALVVRR